MRLGERVYAKHKNRRYYEGTITFISDRSCFWVTFEDESFSKDLDPTDIVVCILFTPYNNLMNSQTLI